MGAISSNGVTLGRGAGESPEQFTTIGLVTNIGGPDGSATEINTTHLGSAAMEFLIGLRDEGQVTFDILYDPDNATHQGLLTDRDNKTLREFQLSLTDSTPTTWTFQAYVQGFSMNVAVDEAVTASVTLRISGTVTRA